MEFEQAEKIVKHVIEGLDAAEYDGIIVKRLESSNTLDEGRSTNQTHIAISGEQMDMFPYLRADGYFQCEYDEKDEQLKKYFIVQIPLRLHKENIQYLAGEIPSEFNFNAEGSLCVRASIVRGRRKTQADQVQLSLTTIDDKAFVAFRRLLHAGDYLVFLKHKGILEYDCAGVRASDETEGDYHLSELNNKFFKLPTNTRVDLKKIITMQDVERLTKAENVLFYGVPGAGKSRRIKKEYCSDEEYMERVVFHPDYTYSDFVGQILPRIEKTESGDRLRYIFTPGPFTRILEKAVNDPGHYYYLVIEELNRGNAPAIFGEIFQLLDRKDDEDEYPESELGESEYGIKNYDVAEKVYRDAEHQVKIPSNLFVLATMNTADQNVFTMDTAFQRRWKMEQVKNDVGRAKHADVRIDGTNVTWGAFAMVINDLVINVNMDIASTEDKRLGAYFAKVKELSVDCFPEKVLKYLWDDAFKMNKEAVFKSDYKSLEDVVMAYESTEGDKLSAVLRMDVYKKMLSKMQGMGDENTQG